MTIEIRDDDLQHPDVCALVGEHLRSMYEQSPPERAILAHIIDVAKLRGYERLSLETGSFDAFLPARKLYESSGFTYCGPFGDYRDDPLSSFMSLQLSPGCSLSC
jgi:hypothetical protein